MKYDVADLRADLARGFPRVVPAHLPQGHRYQREDTKRYAWSVTTKLGFVAKGFLPKWYAKKAVELIRENLPRLLEGDLSVFDLALTAGEDSRDHSADIGTTAHGAIERHLNSWLETGKQPGTAVGFLADGARGEEIAACRSFDKFLAEHEIIPLASELRVWYENGKDCFAGTVDGIFLHLTVRKGRVGSTEVRDLDGNPHTVHDYSYQKGRTFWCSACGREVDARLILADWKSSNHIQKKDDYAQQDTAYAKAVERALKWRFDELWVIRLDKWKACYEICKVTDRKQAWKEFLAISRAFDMKEARQVESLLEPINSKEVIKI